jgi:hypothetical protein
VSNNAFYLAQLTHLNSKIDNVYVVYVYYFRWFFAMISISGVFAVTFSVVFAYVADVTTIEDRSRAYGLVSATFAASLVSAMNYSKINLNSHENYCR